MLSSYDIIKENARTFYNYRTGKPVRVYPRYVLMAVLSAIGAAAFHDRYSDLYASFIAVQSILVGFSFNVLVFLSSTDEIKPIDKSLLESVEKAKKLNKLSGEIVTNLSYFNIVALISIILSIILILGAAQSTTFAAVIAKIHISTGTHWAASVELWVRLILIWTTYFTVLESLVTFIRVTKRVTYFFTEKRAFLQEPVVGEG